MTHSDIRKIREDVLETRATLLASPSADLTHQILTLEAAVSTLRQLEQDGLPASGEERDKLRLELRALKQELQRTEKLVDNGEEFWAGWARLLGMDTGYTPSGAPGLIENTPAASRVVVEG